MNSLIRNHGWLFELLAVAIISYLLAKMSINVVAVQFAAMPRVPSDSIAESLSSPPKSADLQTADYEGIMSRNIFDSESQDTLPALHTEDSLSSQGADVPVHGSGDPVATSLSIELISTFSVGEGKDHRSSATMVAQGTGKEGEIYTVGENFQAGTVIEQILYDRMIFSNNGRLEYVLLNELFGEGASAAPKRKSRERDTASAEGSAKAEGVVQTEDNKFVIDRQELESSLANLDELFRQVRAVPAYKDGKSSGLKLLSVKGDSIFAKLGLKRGDVLEQINGQELDIQRGLELFNSLKSESHINLALLRRGKKLTFDYEVR